MQSARSLLVKCVGEGFKSLEPGLARVWLGALKDRQNGVRRASAAA